jgi:hypothetical protein
MLDVHPPHHAASTWRDFFIHIATIVVGLLIAIGLEQTVEAVHHHHERAETRENLREEINANRETLAGDIRSLDSEQKMLLADIEILHKLRARQTVPPDSLHFNWRWSSMQDAAWQTARETTAIALFPTGQVQAYSQTYGQQGFVNGAGIDVDHAITDAGVTLRIQPDLPALTPAQIDEMIRGCAAALNQIEFAQALIKSLDPDYAEILREF